MMSRWLHAGWFAVLCAAACDNSGGKDQPAPRLGLPGVPTASPPGAQPPPSPGPAAPAPPQAPPAPAPGAQPGYGEVAFKTFEAGGHRLVFTTPTKAKITWRNMVGKAVEGTYVQNGRELEIQWDPNADNFGSVSEKYRQMGPCSMARYERVDKTGKVHDDSPKIYQQTKPRCDTVRLTQ